MLLETTGATCLGLGIRQLESDPSLAMSRALHVYNAQTGRYVASCNMKALGAWCSVLDLISPAETSRGLSGGSIRDWSYMMIRCYHNYHPDSHFRIKMLLEQAQNE